MCLVSRTSGSSGSILLDIGYSHNHLIKVTSNILRTAAGLREVSTNVRFGHFMVGSSFPPKRERGDSTS